MNLLEAQNKELDLLKEFVTYKQALALKELGFDESCFAIYGKSEGGLFKIHTDKFDAVDELRPTYSQAFRFFRENYGWIAEIHGSLQLNHFYANLLLQAKGEVRNIKMCDTYEEAESACLDKLIEIVEKIKK